MLGVWKEGRNGTSFFLDCEDVSPLIQEVSSGLKQLMEILRDLTPSGFALLEAILFVDSLLIMWVVTWAKVCVVDPCERKFPS